MNVQFPYSFDTRGRTADSDQDTNPQNRHIRDLIEQVLFTAPGERVNRPEFGCGLLQVVFAPNSTELVTATQYLVQGALQNILGDLISLNDVAVSASDNELTVLVQYTVRSTQQQQVARFSTGGSSL
ncbi:MAG TPA: GPW/gp25 family protein [Acidobacteriaceae bacterium]|nr:GPW/gp25 family protein [Acidobacteriaceae bacterium]